MNGMVILAPGHLVHVLRPPEDDTTATHRHPWWAGYHPAVDQTTVNHGPPAS